MNFPNSDEEKMIRLAIECSLHDSDSNNYGINSRDTNHFDYKTNNTSESKPYSDTYSLQELAFFTDSKIPAINSIHNSIPSINVSNNNKKNIKEDKNNIPNQFKEVQHNKKHGTISNTSCKSCKKECFSWLGSYVLTQNNDYYHQQCFKCISCNELINNSSYLVVGNSNSIYHSNCFKCQGCLRRIESSSYPDKNQPSLHYCIACYQELFIPKCTLCTCMLNKRYYRHPFFESELYCIDHEGNRKICFSCNRKEPLPIANKDVFIDLLDGRSLCIDCSNTIIIDSSEAEIIYRNIVHFMEIELGLAIPNDMLKVPILLVDNQSLNENINKSGNKTLGYHTNSEMITNVRGVTLSTCSSEVRHIHKGALTSLNQLSKSRLNDSYTSLFQVNEIRDVTAVLVLYGLPKDLIASILAHEAMHVWLKLNKKIPFHITSKIEEGLCQVVSYLYLESVSYNPNLHNIDNCYNNSNMINHNDIITSKQQELLRQYYRKQINDDPSSIYGDGFREMFHIVKLLGLEVLLNYMEEHKELPIV